MQLGNVLQEERRRVSEVYTVWRPDVVFCLNCSINDVQVYLSRLLTELHTIKDDGFHWEQCQWSSPWVSMGPLYEIWNLNCGHVHQSFCNELGSKIIAVLPWPSQGKAYICIVVSLLRWICKLFLSPCGNDGFIPCPLWAGISSGSLNFLMTSWAINDGISKFLANVHWKIVLLNFWTVTHPFPHFPNLACQGLIFQAILIFYCLKR